MNLEMGGIYEYQHDEKRGKWRENKVSHGPQIC